MSDPVPLADIWRGDFRECRHLGHVVIAHAEDGVLASWGDAGRITLPRSSCKMIQALPLVETGAADAAGLDEAHLALACASHLAQPRHTDRVKTWLAALGLGDDALRCGPQPPTDVEARDALVRAGRSPCQYHNNCSGKHSGFLTLTRHLGAGPEYIDPGHPVQTAVRDAFEDLTGAGVSGFAIDGCSAPNFGTTLGGLARAMARFAAARPDGDGRTRAAHRLRQAMMAHPDMVAGEGGADTILMRAAGGRAAIKGGAEGAHIAILPGMKIGVALKIEDGAGRGSEAAIAAILVALGVIAPGDPAVARYLGGPIRNWAGAEVGRIDTAPEFLAGLAGLAGQVAAKSPRA